MITKRNTETGDNQKCGKERELEPIEPEVPKIERHSSESKSQGADQERTGRPVNPMKGNAREHRKSKECALS